VRYLLNLDIKEVLLKALLAVSSAIELNEKEHLCQLLKSLVLCLVQLLATTVKSIVVQSSFRLPIRISQYKQDSFTDYYDSCIFA